MHDLFSNWYFLITIGGLCAVLSWLAINRAAEIKANKDKHEINENTNSEIDAMVNEMNNKFQDVIGKMEKGVEASLAAINVEGQNIIKNLKEDSKQASAEMKSSLDELKNYSEKLKLEKPVYLTLTYLIDKKFLDDDANDYTPINTANILKNYLSSCDYSLTIRRSVPSKDNSTKQELVASYSTIFVNHKFDSDQFSRAITNSLVLVNPDVNSEEDGLVRYTFNIMFMSSTIGDFNSIKVGDRVGFQKRIQNYQKISANHISQIAENSGTVDEFILTTSFNEVFKLKLDEKYELGTYPEESHIGDYGFEVVEKIE
tara:strand:- start:3034 stop:3978 length:945 start_codon:yes stop_codon:yes gene_type:complete